MGSWKLCGHLHDQDCRCAKPQSASEPVTVSGPDELLPPIRSNEDLLAETARWLAANHGNRMATKTILLWAFQKTVAIKCQELSSLAAKAQAMRDVPNEHERKLYEAIEEARSSLNKREGRSVSRGGGEHGSEFSQTPLAPLSLVLEKIELRYKRSLADPYDPETCENSLRDNPRLVKALRLTLIELKMFANDDEGMVRFRARLAAILTESADGNSVLEPNAVGAPPVIPNSPAASLGAKAGEAEEPKT